MKRTKCVKCKKPLVLWRDSCGTGYSWSLYKCSHCKQLMAKGYIPNEVRKDPEVAILRSERSWNAQFMLAQRKAGIMIGEKALKGSGKCGNENK